MRSKRLFFRGFWSGRFAAASLLVAAELTAGLVLAVPSAGPAAAQGGFPFFPFFQSQPQQRRERDPRA
jgi:hypothetical protein